MNLMSRVDFTCLPRLNERLGLGGWDWGWGWCSGGALGEGEGYEQHCGCGVEGRAGYVDAGADRPAEDVGEEAGAQQPGDAAEAVDGALELALFGGAGLAGEK